MSDIIKLLPENVANQIAAGEVVQRPASVVKELLENAIDAGATHIQLIIKNAGKSLIQVVDDGCGMSPSDARMSLERHATSKITKAEDLFNLHTKGFRGEALASIAAVSQLELKTQLHDAEMGTKIHIEGSKVVEQNPEAMTGGTSFSVKNLFYNIPARRNFLKKDSTELLHIIEEFSRVALVHHDIRFTFHSNNTILFDLPSTNRKKRISNISGFKTEEKLVQVEEYTDIISVEGYVIRPEFARKSKEDQYFFVNNRFVKSGYLHHAVKTSMDGLIPPDCQVGYYLYITVPTESIDINIHPTKTEVKFEDEKSIYAILKSAIRQGLARYKVVPSLDFEQEQAYATIFDKNKEIITPTIKVNPSFNPFDEEKRKPIKNNAYTKTELPPKENWENFYTIEEETDSRQKSIEIHSENTEILNHSVIVQFHNEYILCQVKSGLLIIDQKNAHERILYEYYIQRLAMSKESTQQLLFPHEISISASENTLLHSFKNELAQLGFDLIINNNKCIINGVPSTEQSQDADKILRDLIDELNALDQGESKSKKILAASMANVIAIKRGKKLEREEMQHLIDQLFACENPNYSPSGKPTIVTFTKDFLKQQFNS